MFKPTLNYIMAIAYSIDFNEHFTTIFKKLNEATKQLSKKKSEHFKDKKSICNFIQHKGYL